MARAKKTTAKKATTKKSTAKKTTAKKSNSKVKKEISAKAVGRNVILIIDGQKHSKAFPDKTKREEILEKVEAYNKRNSIRKEKEIIELMLKETKKGKRTPKKQEKIEETKNKKSSKTELEKAKELLEKDGYTVSKQTKTAPAPRRRSGEY